MAGVRIRKKKMKSRSSEELRIVGRSFIAPRRVYPTGAMGFSYERKMKSV